VMGGLFFRVYERFVLAKMLFWSFYFCFAVLLATAIVMLPWFLALWTADKLGLQ